MKYRRRAPTAQRGCGRLSHRRGTGISIVIRRAPVNSTARSPTPRGRAATGTPRPAAPRCLSGWRCPRAPGPGGPRVEGGLCASPWAAVMTRVRRCARIWSITDGCVMTATRRITLWLLRHGFRALYQASRVATARSSSGTRTAVGTWNPECGHVSMSAACSSSTRAISPSSRRRYRRYAGSRLGKVSTNGRRATGAKIVVSSHGVRMARHLARPLTPK